MPGAVPFRVGGRGSKQLSKAIEISHGDRGVSEEIAWVFCSGVHPCFAKVISFATTGVMIQPMSPVEGDPHLYQLWEGHLWMEKKDHIHPVQMKQELGGWRIQYSSTLRQLVQSTVKICPQFPPEQTILSPTQRCDLISLEGSEFDDQSSTDLTIVSFLPSPSKPSVCHDAENKDNSILVDDECNENSSTSIPETIGSHEVIILSSPQDYIAQIQPFESIEIIIHDLCNSDRDDDDDDDEISDLTPFQTPISQSPVTTPQLSPAIKISDHGPPRLKKRQSEIVPVVIEFSGEKIAGSRRSQRWKKDEPPPQDKTIPTSKSQSRKKHHEVRTPPLRKIPPRNGGKTKPERDACFGLWTSRYQSAASGSWTI
jgi:hypothetical protein